jgi:nitrate/nitrite transport system ATP-binding protein
MSYLELKSVRKSYQRSGKRQAGVSAVLPVLRDINLSIRENEFVCIVGRSGSGKTTLISLIAGLIEPDGGTILLEDKPIADRDRTAGDFFRTILCCPGRCLKMSIWLSTPWRRKK